MRRSRKKLASSYDGLDDTPLESVSKRLLGRSNVIKELRRFSLQACEFCERKFENRYDFLVHNSKHIIIPLIKQKPLNCTQCGWYCISEDHLNDHTSIKHKGLQCNDLDSKSKISDRILFEDNNAEFDTEEFTKDDVTDKLIQMEIVERNNGDILKDFMKNCKVDVVKFEPPWLEVNENDIENNKVTKWDSVAKIEPSSDVSEYDDPITLLRPSYGSIEQDVTECRSIHFDDLMKPGIFHCKHCIKRFPNRYEVIVHELVHLNLSKAITNRRMKKEHKKQDPKMHASKPSNMHKSHNKLNLRHNKDLSTETYKKYKGPSNESAEREESPYKHHCGICEMGCTSKKIKMAHEEKCYSLGTKTMHMCDACTFSMKTKKKMEFTTIGKICNLIAKPECQRCGKLFHEVSLVRLTPKRQKTVNRIKFESSDDRQSKTVHLPLSNRARLKNIQNRFKLINKYNALYNIVLLSCKIERMSIT